MKVRDRAVRQVCLVVAHSECMNFRLSGSSVRAVAEVQSGLLESIVEGEMKHASFLPSDG